MLHGALFGELLAQCWKVIRAMPPVRQRVFYLRAEEMDNSEIARQLGISQSTVRDHIKAGLADLNSLVGPMREIFDDLDDDRWKEGGE